MKKFIGISIAVCLSGISLFTLFGCQSANPPDTGGNDTEQTESGSGTETENFNVSVGTRCNESARWRRAICF